MPHDLKIFNTTPTHQYDNETIAKNVNYCQQVLVECQYEQFCGIHACWGVRDLSGIQRGAVPYAGDKARTGAVSDSQYLVPPLLFPGLCLQATCTRAPSATRKDIMANVPELFATVLR